MIKMDYRKIPSTTVLVNPIPYAFSSTQLSGYLYFSGRTIAASIILEPVPRIRRIHALERVGASIAKLFGGTG